MKSLTYTRLRPFHQSDLAPLVDFWNNAFGQRRNFYTIRESDFQTRILDCEAFDPDGLILAWHDTPAGTPQLVGLAHAFRPTPRHGLYARWEARHELALLYVDPAFRRQGIGSRLLKAAENWLYYCPVHVGGPAQPCYGTVEGPRSPFFGSTQNLGVSVHDTILIRFLAKRGYHVVEPGDVSMRLTLPPQPLSPGPLPTPPDLAARGLRLQLVSHTTPFVGREPFGREEYTFYGDNGGDPYWAYLLVTEDQLLQAHISWYPMHAIGDTSQTPNRRRAAIAGFWVAPALRGHGFGRYLLDRTLHELQHAAPPRGGYQEVEVHTHLVKHAQAAALYERRGFVTEMAWVNLSKECAVRGVNPP